MWKPETIVTTIIFGCLIAVFGVMAYIKAFESGLIVLIVLWIFSWIVTFAMLRLAYLRELMNKKKQEKEEDLDYCWAMANEILGRLPGGRQLLWERGQGRDVDARTFLDHANRPNFFYAFVAFTEGSSELNVVYYNATKKNIQRITTMPEGQVWRDKFVGFKPFERSGQMGNFNPNNSRGRVNVTVGGDGYPQPMGNLMPTPGYVEDSYEQMQGQRNDGN